MIRRSKIRPPNAELCNSLRQIDAGTACIRYLVLSEELHHGPVQLDGSRNPLMERQYRKRTGLAALEDYESR